MKSLLKFIKISFLLLLVFNISGCDRFFIKRIDVLKNNENQYLDLNNNISIIIDQTTKDRNFKCIEKSGYIKYCNDKNNGGLLVAFEEKNKVSTCYILMGTLFGTGYDEIVNTLDKSISTNFSSKYITSSPNEKIAECVLPEFKNK